MLTKNQFDALFAVLRDSARSQRALAAEIGVSVGTINTALRDLKAAGFIGVEGTVTQAGREALEPYKVDNAIIMAAGLSSRFAPISYERP